VISAFRVQPLQFSSFSKTSVDSALAVYRIKNMTAMQIETHDIAEKRRPK
jgi:hypothetical protein